MADQRRRQFLSVIMAAGAVGAMASYGSRTQANQHISNNCRVQGSGIDSTQQVLVNELAYTLFLRDVQNAFFMFRQIVTDAELTGCEDIDALRQLEKMERQGSGALFELLPLAGDAGDRGNISSDLANFSHNNILENVGKKIDYFLRRSRAIFYQDDSFLDNNNNPRMDIIERPLEALFHAERILLVRQLAVNVNAQPQGICDIFPISKFCEWFDL